MDRNDERSWSHASDVTDLTAEMQKWESFEQLGDLRRESDNMNRSTKTKELQDTAVQYW